MASRITAFAHRAGVTLVAFLHLPATGLSQTLDVPPQPLLAYTHFYYHCGSVGCNAYGYPNATEVLTPDHSTMGTADWSPSWSIAFVSSAFDEWQGIYIMKSDGSSVTLMTDYADSPAWRPLKLDADFAVQCDGLACRFDAATSLGSIAAYAWDYGDQTGGSGVAASHTFGDGGDHTITLTVTDLSGDMATETRTIHLMVNRPPEAAFTYSCASLTCIFNWSASGDPDGSIASVRWDFGDGTSPWQSSGGGSVIHVYPAFGSYTASLTVTDDYAAQSTVTATITLAGPASMHIGDIDSVQTSTKSPTSVAAIVTVHTADEMPLSNVQVTAQWSDQTIQSCTSDASGTCRFSKTGLKPTSRVTLAVALATRSNFVFDPATNHDPDGDSDGTSITLTAR